MAPDQRGQVGDVVVVDIHALLPDVANGFLHVDGVPVYDDIEGEAQGAKSGALSCGLMKSRAISIRPASTAPVRSAQAKIGISSKLGLCRRSKPK
jgi:hypothetical protein